MSSITIRKQRDCSPKIFQDRRLSWEASGLLAYVLSHPTEWKCELTHLNAQRRGGVNKVRRLLKELERVGYLQRRHVLHNNDYRWLTVIVDDPALDGFAVIPENADNLAVALFTSASRQNFEDPNLGTLKLLSRFGMPARWCMRLIKMDHITEEYVRAHLLAAQAAGDRKDIVMHRMTYAEPPPNSV